MIGCSTRLFGLVNAMKCYPMLCYPLLCCAMLTYAILCDPMCNATSLRVMLRCMRLVCVQWLLYYASLC